MLLKRPCFQDPVQAVRSYPFQETQFGVSDPMRGGGAIADVQQIRFLQALLHLFQFEFIGNGHLYHLLIVRYNRRGEHPVIR